MKKLMNIQVWVFQKASLTLHCLSAMESALPIPLCIIDSVWQKLYQVCCHFSYWCWHYFLNHSCKLYKQLKLILTTSVYS